MTGMWGTAQEVWGDLVVPLVGVTRPPHGRAVLLHPQNHQPLCYPMSTFGLGNRKGVTGTAQPGMSQRTNQTAGAKAAGYADKSKPATENTDFLSSS